MARTEPIRCRPDPGRVCPEGLLHAVQTPARPHPPSRWRTKNPSVFGLFGPVEHIRAPTRVKRTHVLSPSLCAALRRHVVSAPVGPVRFTPKPPRSLPEPRSRERPPCQRPLRIGASPAQLASNLHPRDPATPPCRRDSDCRVSRATTSASLCNCLRDGRCRVTRIAVPDKGRPAGSRRRRSRGLGR